MEEAVGRRSVGGAGQQEHEDIANSGDGDSGDGGSQGKVLPHASLSLASLQPAEMFSAGERSAGERQVQAVIFAAVRGQPQLWAKGSWAKAYKGAVFRQGRDRRRNAQEKEMKVEPMKIKGAILYTRVSTGDQDKNGTSPETQLPLAGTRP